jgi:HlyD family secretion protein
MKILRLPVLLSMAALWGLSACHKPEQAKPAAAQTRTVSVVRVEQRPVVDSITATGDLTPREEAAVTAEVTGYRVSRVLADVGDYVRAGQTLVQLDPALLQGQLAQAQAQAAQAEDQARRVAGLDDEGVLPQEQIAQRRFQADVARANLRDLQTRMRKMAVVAPVSGLILERTVRPGDLSAGGATPWFRMARDGQVELAAQLSQEDLARVRPGQRAQVTLPSGGQVIGVVRLVSPQIDPQTKLGQVRLTLPVRSDIRAGGFGRAAFSDVTSLVLAVPETAIRYDADGASVMVVGEDNRVRRMSIQAGQRGGGFVQLVRGPAAGARVVRNAAGLLIDGDLIKPIEGAAAARPATRAPAPKAASR